MAFSFTPEEAEYDLGRQGFSVATNSFVTTNVSYPFYRLLDTRTTMKISLGEIAPRDSTRAILPSFEFRGEARRA